MMKKTILITGATDGIGLLTAKKLAQSGHKVLIHGRSASKLEAAVSDIGAGTEQYLADFSDLAAVKAMADQVLSVHNQLDVLINNAGVYKTNHPFLADGQDVRFVVNTLAPYALTSKLLPILAKDGRVINLSSAAQAKVTVDALLGQTRLGDMDAYAQSKLALTIWSQHLAHQLVDGPAIIAVNPGSLLATKMVREGFGVAGSDLNIGADILCDAALSDTFAEASGRYFDNDAGRFGQPHRAASDPMHVKAVMEAIERMV